MLEIQRIYCRIMNMIIKGMNWETEIESVIILPFVFYGCETLSLTLREVRRLRVFENRVLRRMFGPRRDEVTWDWRTLHIE